MVEGVIGEIRLLACKFVPLHWQTCDGGQLEVRDYPELFSLIGYTYGGQGDKFKVPDLRGRLAIGAGRGLEGEDYLLGARLGQEAVTLREAHLPAHGHGFNVTNAPATSAEPGRTRGFGNVPASQSFYIDTAQPTTGSIAFAPQAIGMAGDGLPHRNMMPWLALRYIICCRGGYPHFG